MHQDITIHTEEIAKIILGEPNRHLSSKSELRYGRQGSVSVEIAGEKRGQWYDHEQKVGGGVIDLICERAGVPRHDISHWLDENLRRNGSTPHSETTSATCASCGKRFSTENKTAKYCSNTCRQAGFRAKVRREDNVSASSAITETYDYTDEAGTLLFQVCRIEQSGKPKTFRQRRPDGNGGWTWGVKGVRQVPYRLSDILERGEDEVVFVVEGEKDADALTALGVTATTNAQGAGKWTSEHAEHLRGALVCILPDNDDAGRQHAKTVSQSLDGVAEETITLELPNLPEKGDVSDWIAAGGTADDLFALIEAGPVQGQHSEETEAKAPPPVPEPDPLADVAYYGVIGEIVRKLEPQTESDPAALLTQLIISIGSIIGRQCYVQVESTQHWPNLFAVICGGTASARKGTGWRRVRNVARQIDDTWPRCGSGVASGEGVIDAVHDAEYGLDKKGRKVLKRGAVEDKRLLIVEEEFGRLLRVSGREGNITSQVLRDAWDGGDLRSMARGAGITATEAHISLIGHITLEELMEVQTGSSVANGFYNRFLWIYSKRSKVLPFGGIEVDLQAEVASLQRILAARLEESERHGRSPLRMRMSSACNDLWEEAYGRYTAEGHPMKARALPLILRIALILAYTEPNLYEIEPRHLTAAEAIVAYSMRTIDRTTRHATANTTINRILAAIELNRTMTSTEIHNAFSRHISGREIQEACAELVRKGLVRKSTMPAIGGGKPKTLWAAVKSEFGT